jgi:hypothetical protein
MASCSPAAPALSPDLDRWAEALALEYVADEGLWNIR